MSSTVKVLIDAAAKMCGGRHDVLALRGLDGAAAVAAMIEV